MHNVHVCGQRPLPLLAAEIGAAERMRLQVQQAEDTGTWDGHWQYPAEQVLSAATEADVPPCPSPLNSAAIKADVPSCLPPPPKAAACCACRSVNKDFHGGYGMSNAD
eukprot:113564-Chlamydomonas_euryale.AAC.4